MGGWVGWVGWWVGVAVESEGADIKVVMVLTSTVLHAIPMPSHSTHAQPITSSSVLVTPNEMPMVMWLVWG